MDLSTILIKSEKLYKKIYNTFNNGGRDLPNKCKKIDLETSDTSVHSTLYVALKNNRHFLVNDLLNRGSHFGAVNSTGKFAGFTALHYACLQGHIKVVKKLLKQYSLNPTEKACDGVEPIHLAAFRGNFDIIIEIFRHNVGYTAKLKYSHFQRYAIIGHKWERSFSDEMPLLAYIVLNNNEQHLPSLSSLAVELLTIVPTWSIGLVWDTNNRTLVMHAIKSKQWDFASEMFNKLPKQELIRRDDAGFSVVHMLAAYIIDAVDNIEDKNQSWKCLRHFRYRRVKIDVLTNSDLRIFSINIAAYCGDLNTLSELLKKQSLIFQPSARPLFYFTKARNDEVRCSRGYDDDINEEQFLNYFLCEPGFYKCDLKILQIIIEDIYKKLLCKYPVHKEEIALIKHWVTGEATVKEFVKKINAKYKIIETKMKNINIFFGDRKMSFYEALTAQQKDYNLVARIENYKVDVHRYYDKDIDEFAELIDRRLQETRDILFVIVKKREKIALRLIKSFVVPYDCVLTILEYLSTYDLNNLIKVYFKKTLRENPLEL